MKLLSKKTCGKLGCMQMMLASTIMESRKSALRAEIHYFTRQFVEIISPAKFDLLKFSNSAVLRRHGKWRQE